MYLTTWNFYLKPCSCFALSLSLSFSLLSFPFVWKAPFLPPSSSPPPPPQVYKKWNSSETKVVTLETHGHNHSSYHFASQRLLAPSPPTAQANTHPTIHITPKTPQLNLQRKVCLKIEEEKGANADPQDKLQDRVLNSGDCFILNVRGKVFELQSCYYVHFRANTLGKGMNPKFS